MTTADILNMKLDMICLVSSVYLVLENETQEQKTATQEHHLIRSIKAHMEKIIPSTFM